jgi:hypothetical protein
VQRTIEQYLGAGGYPADAHREAESAAFSMGFAFDAPATPVLDQLAALTAKGDSAGVARIYSLRFAQLAAERAAKSFHDGLAGWRASITTMPDKPGHVEAGQ